MNNYLIGRNATVRDRVASQQIGFPERFALLSSLTFCVSQGVPKQCPGKSLFMMSRIILGIPQVLIGLSLVVCFLKYEEYVFSYLRLMAFLNTSDCIFMLL